MESSKLAFLGLGVMGFPMAGHLARAGHASPLQPHARQGAQWVEKHGGSAAPTPAAAAAARDVRDDVRRQRRRRARRRAAAPTARSRR